MKPISIEELRRDVEELYAEIKEPLDAARLARLQELADNVAATIHNGRYTGELLSAQDIGMEVVGG